jgi:putative CocE/NonD family hydrolase
MLDAPATAAPRLLRRLRVAADDDAALCTDVFLPPGLDTAPAVLVRTPYGRQAPFLQLLALRLARSGLAVVLQDSRGRYQSEGRYDLRSETPDGRATLAWLAQQPWCDGRVAVAGVSIGGYPAFRMCLESPPPGVRLLGMLNLMGVFDHHALFYRGGALVLHWALPWCTMMADEYNGRTAWQRFDWPALFRTLPPVAALRGETEMSRLWTFAATTPEYESQWAALDIHHRLDELTVPALHVTGWYDFLLGQVVQAFLRAGDGPAGDRQRLVIGPWDHQTIFSALGRGSNGNDAPIGPSLLDVIADWLGQCFDGPSASAAFPGDSRCLIHVGDRWLAARHFPPPEAREHQWFLSSDGAANGAAGHGALAAAPAPGFGFDTYLYDPANPVPTVGGAIWPFPAAGLKPGPADQTSVEQRDDVLVFTGTVLDEPLVVVGPISVELWAASSACDTDFTAKLVDVGPDGTTRIVQDGIVRGRFAESRANARPLVPHSPQRFIIDLDCAGYIFDTGHRLRVDVSSSNFPRFDRSVNGATEVREPQALPVATQTVFHGEMLASRLRLFAMPGESARDHSVAQSPS